jgi:isopenicillin-N N-acyltransferase like protein
MRSLVLRVDESPRQWGQSHGESFRGEVRSLADIRIYLTIKVGGFADEGQVLDVARAHLPVLERYDALLHDELVGIAEGAGLSPAHIVVLNHYTDLRDIDARAWPAGTTKSREDSDSGCSVLWVRSQTGPILAQTWDMHATAIPYMMVLRVPEHQGRPESWLLGLTGCLGMAGMNRHGVGVAINNLRSADARVGIVWPALVRRALAAITAASARDIIMSAPIGSGHHYMTADAHSAYGIETSGTRRKVMFESDVASTHYVHTNHCLDPEIAEVSRDTESSTTHERYDWLSRSVADTPVRDVHDAWTRLGSDEGFPRSVCSNMSTPENPHGTATCGAVAMELFSRRFWAQAGLIHNVTPERFDFAEIPE